MTVRTSIALLVFAAHATGQVGIDPDDDRHVRGELIVGVENWEQKSEALDGIRLRGGRVRDAIPRLGAVLVGLPADADEELEAVRYRALDGVRYVERNAVGEGGSVDQPDDSYFVLQWHLRNHFWPGHEGKDIEILPAWAIQQGDPSVVVAVLDSGIDYDHPEFVGRLLPGYDFVDEDADPTADHPHGIQVTGIIAANVNNDFSVAGVDPACSILPVKVLNSLNQGTAFNLAQGIDYAAAEGAEVLSMSLINYPGTQTLRNALAAARASGAILLACAGNGGFGDADDSWPSASEHTISIGWTSFLDARVGNSGTGAALDFVAPGSNITTVDTASYDDWTDSFSGCSAATPVTAGIVSLLLAQRPGLSQDEVYAALVAGAEDRVGPATQDTPGRDDYYGHGRLNAYRSLNALPSAVGVRYCEAKPNSTGAHAGISIDGSVRVGDNDVTLSAACCPPTTHGIFFFGASVVDLPFGDGRRCVGGAPRRLQPPLVTDACGIAIRGVDLAALPAGVAVPGTETRFQFWYRDGAGGSAGFNLTDAVSVLWE